jgi:protein-S-isoprenylcysteine O-methyltransferase Ste14
MSQTITEPGAARPRLDRYGYNGVARHITLPIFTSALLFLGAGTLNWAWGWAFSIVYFLCWLGICSALVTRNPELLNARGRRTTQLTGTKSWDWAIMSVYAVIIIVQPFVAGLDWRNGWSSPSAPMVYVAGNALNIAAHALLGWSMVVNRFFDCTVRIQEQRGHEVISAGPYRYVRHPGYVSVIVTFVALPLALGTWTALIPGGIGILLYLIRTALEDRTLYAELPGYADYAQQTRHRLLPGVW